MSQREPRAWAVESILILGILELAGSGSSWGRHGSRFAGLVLALL